MRIQNKKRFYLMMGLWGLVLIILVVFSIRMIWAAVSIKNTPVQTTNNTAAVDATQGNRTGTTASQAIIDPTDMLVLVNKTTSLAEDYVPSDLVWVDLPGVRETQLRKEAAAALEDLFDAATAKKLSLYCCSGYRSYQTQEELYTENVKTFGQKEADLVSAKPGQSEHQTGLAMDVTAESVNFDLQESFGQTPEGEFIKNNAHQYGFIIRYPKDKTAITGYAYEPWHLRYVGKDVASEIYADNLTFEEYLKAN
nr:M15 family metallopeptidase [uncultured Acetobacterium sp.]